MNTRMACWVLRLGAVLLAGAAWAKPAPWYWWVSKHDGQRTCAQFMPSQGWLRGEGPFYNAQCQVGTPRTVVPGR